MLTNITGCFHIGDNGFVLVYIALPVCFLVICESALTIVTVLRSPVLHENQYLFLLSLALTDSLLAVVSTVATYINLPSIRHSFRSNIMETITFGLHNASVTVIGVHMSIIAIDRYIRLAHPFYYLQKITKQQVIKILICGWILWTFLTCLPLVVSNDITNWTCIYRQPPLGYYFTTLGITSTCLVIVIVCYFKVALLAIGHKKAAIARRHQNGANRDTAVTSSNNIVMKSIKFFVTMFGVYFVCTLLPFIFTSMNLFMNISDLVQFILSYLFPLHSVLNFFICSGMDKRFLKALKVTLTCPRNTSCLRCLGGQI